MSAMWGLCELYVILMCVFDEFDVVLMCARRDFVICFFNLLDYLRLVLSVSCFETSVVRFKPVASEYRCNVLSITVCSITSPEFETNIRTTLDIAHPSSSEYSI